MNIYDINTDTNTNTETNTNTNTSTSTNINTNTNNNTNYRRREHRKEGGKGWEKNILGFWFKFVSKVVYNGGS